MTLKTLIENQSNLIPAVVEIELIPGIPQIHFLGLPDKVIKESFFRIKAALKSAGYRFPVSQQVIVNIRPSAIKKSSQGLELAVALGILHLTGQKELSEKIKEHIIYGELDLNGGVREPDDLVCFRELSSHLILTGKTEKTLHGFSRLTHLNDEVIFSENQRQVVKLTRPDKGLKNSYSQEEAELIFLMATSGLHTLLAGQAGAGKSFLAKSFTSFYCSQTSEMPRVDSWYPVIAPHHSLTAGAFLGGTSQLVHGEIEKVENGVLILDEFLEFHSQILESLREPMTGEMLRIARAGRVKEIKPEFQVVATSNFCPCGKWIPEYDYTNCRFTAQKCKGYLNRLTGPLADRFGLIYFHKTKRPKRQIQGYEILQRIDAWLTLKQKHQVTCSSELIEAMYGDLSGRRQQALIKVAEIYATEEQALEVSVKHLKKSETWTIQGFLQLEKGMC